MPLGYDSKSFSRLASDFTNFRYKSQIRVKYFEQSEYNNSVGAIETEINGPRRHGRWMTDPR